MATVSLRLSPLPAHVRTARLVATAMARRGGVPEGQLDDVRLAVGEACARAVRLHQRHAVAEPVTVEMTDGNPFTVIVTDTVSGTSADAPADALVDALADVVVDAPGDVVVDAPGGAGRDPAAAGGPPPAATRTGTDPAAQPAHRGPAEPGGLVAEQQWEDSERLVLAVLAGVVDDLRVDRAADGTRVHMRWPVGD